MNKKNGIVYTSGGIGHSDESFKELLLLKNKKKIKKNLFAFYMMRYIEKFKMENS